jgi:hypothetical protein
MNHILIDKDIQCLVDFCWNVLCGLQFSKQNDQQMVYTEWSSSFLPVADIILASLTSTSTNCELEAMDR